MERGRRHAQNTRRMDYSGRNGNICRRFINGFCRYGSRCNYRHERPVLPSSQICRYFQKGGCWYGENCRYLHVLQPEVAAGRRGSVPTVSSFSVVYAPPDRRGSEPALLQAEVTSRQESSRSESVVIVSNHQHNTGHLAADIAEEQTQDVDSHLAASRESVHSLDIAQATTHNRCNEQGASSHETTEDGGAAAAAPSTKRSVGELEAYHQSKNVTCGICMETVYEKPDPRSHMFGILPNCNHSYCLQCIMTWRKTRDLGPDTVKTCPQCRVRSAFYVPNKYWVEGEEKESLVSTFKEKFRMVPLPNRMPLQTRQTFTSQII
ncbi:makorin, ring finger protein, 4 isoform X2 [Cheilinus undulatus]|uniref:makorin, ring finger protein, 4 isoform X2 n=1 Tax=Cheilinus undulatus TaxID=241271 RepID=UPI001BD5FB1F|nr:makorin, ring finger protein, 4 isoform X2 [Cheilinus undulatus]